MENLDVDEKAIFLNNLIKEKEKEEIKIIGPSELALSLRKNKIYQKLGKLRISKETIPDKVEFGNKEVEKLCDLSKFLYEEKDFEKIINILDEIYMFFINFKKPIKSNFIEISKIIPHLYTKMSLLKNKEIVISKIFDIFDQIIRLTQSDDISDKFSRIFNEKYCQLLYGLIDFYQNNNIIAEKFFNFLCNITKKSDAIKAYLMINPGFYFLQAIFSLDTKYPQLLIKLMSTFYGFNGINDNTMKDFQIMFVEKCDKIISLFYQENHTEPKNIINNSFLFVNLYKCLSYISLSNNKEILNYFLLKNRNNNITLYEKILFFETFDKDHLCNETLKITGNLYCSSDINHIQSLIECNSYQFIMDIILERFNNNTTLNNAVWALSNFVNVKQYRQIFIKNKYINDLISVIRRNNCFEVIKQILNTILNLFNSVKEYEMMSFVDCDIFPCCIEILTNFKEPTILDMVLKIIELMLLKGDPNKYLDCYYKNNSDKITNPLKYQFEYYGLPDVLENLLISSKNKHVLDSAKNIIERYFDDNQIITD